MKCARCGTPLDEGVMVCSHCGAVVGMTYGRAPATSKPTAVKPAMPAKPAMPMPGAPHAGTTMRLRERVKHLLLSPRSEWNAIAAEPATAMDIWLGYVIPLALIGPIALAIAQVAFGTSFPLVGVVKADLATGLAAGLLTFAFTLVQVAVLASVVHAMAPRFGAVPDRLGALKVVAYSMTPVWLAGVLYLLPVLAFLTVLAALYAFLLCLFGLRVVMRCSAQQALGYAFTALAIAFVLWLVTGVIVTALLGIGPVMLE
jgi:hypothetical protein